MVSSGRQPGAAQALLILILLLDRRTTSSSDGTVPEGVIDSAANAAECRVQPQPALRLPSLIAKSSPFIRPTKLKLAARAEGEGERESEAQPFDVRSDRNGGRKVRSM